MPLPRPRARSKMNDQTIASSTLQDLRQQRRKQRKERRSWNLIQDELSYDIIPSLLNEDDIRYILSVPAEMRDAYYRVNDPDIVFQYVPREHDGFVIGLDRAVNILGEALEAALERALEDTEGCVFSSISDSICINNLC